MNKNNHYHNLFKFSLKNIKEGFKKIGNGIETATKEKQILYLGMNRFLSHARAIILLCDNSQNTEALMILRAILELAINLRWVLEDETKKNLKLFLKNAEYKFDGNIPEMGNFWEINFCIHNTFLEINHETHFI